jgi:oligoribonuclease
VSSIKELAKRWYPALPAYKKKKAHLALSDIQESISELRYYREKVFVDVSWAASEKKESPCFS